jgi:hypothetical protein
MKMKVVGVGLNPAPREEVRKCALELSGIIGRHSSDVGANALLLLTVAWTMAHAHPLEALDDVMRAMRINLLRELEAETSEEKKFH